MKQCVDCVLSVMVREWRLLFHNHRLWPVVIIVPLLGVMFFTTMLHNGLPELIPIAIVDKDNSKASRLLVSNLGSQQSIDIVMMCNSYSEARNAMQKNEIYGFLIIPDRFQQLLWDGKQPSISFYTNDAFLIPGSLLYKSFKTQSLLTSAAVVSDVLSMVNVSPQRIETLLQPIVVDMHPLGNPWINYSIYLSNSFIPALLQLMILLTTVYVVGSEWKHRTVGDWMAVARGNATIAFGGKILLYTLIFIAVGVVSLWLLYGELHYPFHTHAANMIVALVLLVVAAQGLALVILSLSPTLSVAYSVAAVMGVVSFSLGGFSFPVADMYAPFHPLSALLPVRHYFLIYVNNALNGYPVYYCRGEYMSLMLFVVLAALLLPVLIMRTRRYINKLQDETS